MLKAYATLVLFCSVALIHPCSAQPSLKDITDAVADLSCDNSNQCKAIGVGKMQCGGPSRFLSYSLKTVTEANLEALVSQYNNSITFPPGSVGICIVPAAQFPACIAGKCTAEAQIPVVRPLEGKTGTLVIDLPNIVYFNELNQTVSPNGVQRVEGSGKTTYRARLVSFVDEKDGVMKFKIESVSRIEVTPPP